MTLSLKEVLTLDIEDCTAITFDIIIVGSGACGGAAAISLAEKNLNILIIEAGPLLLTEHVGSLSLRYNPPLIKKLSEKSSSQALWQDNTQRLNREQVWTVAGGKTLFWGGHSPRFREEEFNKWPIEKDLLQDCYCWAEDFLHINKNFFANQTQSELIKSSQEQGLTIEPASLALEDNGNPSTLPNMIYSSIHTILAHSQYTVNLNQTGIHLACDAKALKIQHQNKRIKGIEVKNMVNGEKCLIKARHYILACGAMRSNQLVLHSLLETPAFLTGQYLSEHLFCKGLIRLSTPLTEPVYLHVPAQREKPYLFEIHGPLNQTWYDNNHATIWLDWIKNQSYLLLYGFGVAEIIQENKVTLHSEEPGYKVYYNHTITDHNTMKEMHDSAKKIAKSLNGSLEKIEFQPPGSSYHERGGLLMGSHPKHSVVNDKGRFWNYENLYCMDSAIWPSQDAANSCLTITALTRYLTCRFMNF
ncbi:GMC oxidoreductase (plasmid) [Legionella sp. D16C41]|uniref:GMC oxidoreductase n=1 Tax=Legionella sp. D16C41 TaxID=3402688 RepID=UPI003AF6AA3D